MASLLKQLPRNALWGFGLMLAATAYVIWQQSFFWSHREDYSFGYLVPLFVAYVVFMDRWESIRGYLTGEAADAAENPAYKLRPKDSAGAIPLFEGLALLGLAVGLLFIGFGAFHRAVSGPHDRGVFAVSLGLAAFILSMAFLISDADARGRFYTLASRFKFTFIFLFPALIWLVSSPMLYGLEKTIQILLLEKVTIIVYHFFDFLNIPVIREGNILHLGPDNQVGVEEACSGIRSLTACIFAGSFLAATFLDKFWKKVLMVTAAMVLAFLTNILRSLFLTYWSWKHGGGAINMDFFGNYQYLIENGEVMRDASGEFIPNPELVFGSVHDITGYAVLGLTCIGLLLLLPIFNYKLPELEDEDGGDETDEPEATQNPQPEQN